VLRRFSLDASMSDRNKNLTWSDSGNQVEDLVTMSGGTPPIIACMAIKQSFAERDVIHARRRHTVQAHLPTKV
jgi:hypothetical protein